MIIDWPTLMAAFLLGLFSSAHCIGMCGGIMGALSMAIPAPAQSRRVLILFSYNAGRIFSYVVMGIVVGAFAQQITAAGGALWLRWLAGLLLIAMGLYLANWWHGLSYLETGGRYLWVYIQPLGKKLMPVDKPLKALLLGGIWGWLPCGLVYSALAYAMAQGQWLAGGLTMLAFGLGTLPTLMLAGLAAQQLKTLLQRRQLRWTFALIVILFGGWTIWAGGHGQHHQHVQGDSVHSGMDHSNHSAMNHTDMNHADMNHADMNHAGMDHSAQQVQSSEASSSAATEHHHHH